MLIAPALASAAGGSAVTAHAIHLAIITLGLVGVVALLAPRFLSASERPADAHEERVRALIESIEGDTLTTQRAAVLPTTRTRPASTTSLTAAQHTLLPLAVVCSAAAAGVHAAVGPIHFREATLIGLFFAVSAALQVFWAGAAALSCTRRLLLLGTVGNVAVVALWVVTRTVGLPFGLLPEPEAVGPWDLACAAWELGVAASCVAILRRADPVPSRLADWWSWRPGVRLVAVASVLGLVALSLSGAGA